jgi:hypothetical protein
MVHDDLAAEHAFTFDISITNPLGLDFGCIPDWKTE